MMTKNDIKKIASKLWHQKKGMRSYTIMHPEREWAIGLLFALVLTVVTGSWSAYTYLQNKLLIETGLEVEMIEETVYRESLVEDAKELFRQREAVLGGLSAAPAPPIADIELATTSVPTSPTEIESVGEEPGPVEATVAPAVEAPVSIDSNPVLIAD